ncbi:MAG: selenocysteine-specific translation elongation factor [Acidimicrobiia bacterium]|nr:MAG: selenocysteine-specific translation elongation factor [Acidimicrobiia bacterium]
MPIVGTAGHVDHGKSTLVQAMTGRDPDRWAEEKERGLTIDLGFAWADLNGIDVGFVDVPGHERFIKNMLAGVGAIDCALLVVAADSGWMPQTEEHAAVLDLLDTSVGVIALTRIDLVDDDTAELATLEIMDEIEGTSLEGWPVVPVSAITGEGMESLIDHIASAIERADKHDAGYLKMWIDRSFTVSGAGVVVTGTVASGEVAVGDEVEILPSGLTDRVRGLHHHDQTVGSSAAGSRTAINLQGSKLAGVARGNLICTPGTIRVSSRLLASLKPARSFEEIPQRGAFHLHVGTAHSPATIRRLHGTDAYLISLDTALPLAMGDRFILRDSGRQAVVGGGRVLNPRAARRTTRDQIETLQSSVGASPTEMADALLAVHGVMKTADILMATGGGSPSDGLLAGDTMLSRDEAASTIERSIKIVSTYHKRFPLRPGIPKPELATQVGVELAVINAAVAASAALEQSDGAVRLKDFTDTLTATQESEWSIVKSDLEGSFDVPRMNAIDLSDEVIRALVRRGDLVQVAPDLVFTGSQVNEIYEGIGDLLEGFSVGDFKGAFGMTRRQAVPTLEWLDKSGWTKRSGDGRTVRRRP